MGMARLLSLLWLALLLLPAAAETPVTRQEAQAAIARFRAEPQTATGLSFTTPILRYMLNSPEVVVDISSRATPFFQDPIDQPTKSRLLAAFGAGNVQAQWARNTKGDQTLAGVLMMIEVYQQLRQSQPALRSAGVEKLIELRQQGKLEAFLAGRS